jgi:hypothetical protein
MVSGEEIDECVKREKVAKGAKQVIRKSTTYLGEF